MSGQKKPWVWILLTLAVLVFGCLATCMGSVAFCGLSSKKAMDGAGAEVREFFGVLKTNDLRKAYERTAGAYQLETPFADFEKMVTGADLTHQSALELTMNNIQLNYGKKSEASFKVVVRTTASTANYVFVVEQKPGEPGKGPEPWRIRYITPTSN